MQTKEMTAVRSILLFLTIGQAWIKGTVATDQVCEGEKVHSQCNGHCVATCILKDPHCTQICTEGCLCPDHKPIQLPDGTCGMAKDCSSSITCSGDQIFILCSSHCVMTCDDLCEDQSGLLLKEMCVGRCACPATNPVLLNPGDTINDPECGTVDSCYDFKIDYASRADFSMLVIKAENKKDLDPYRILMGHPDNFLRATLNKSSKVVIKLTVDTQDNVQEATIVKLCLRAENVKKLQIEYKNIKGKRLWRAREEGGTYKAWYFEEKIKHVHTIKFTFRRLSSTNSMVIQQLKMPENRSECLGIVTDPLSLG